MIERKAFIFIFLAFFTRISFASTNHNCSVEGFGKKVEVSIDEESKLILFHNQNWKYSKKEVVVSSEEELPLKLKYITSFYDIKPEMISIYKGIKLDQGEVLVYEYENNGKMEWVFFGQGIILSRCIQNFEPKEFSVDLGVLEQARILATSIVNNALGVSSSEKILNLKTAIINAELRFGNCYSQKAHACVNLKYSNQIRFNSKRDTPISRFYGSFEEPLLNIAQTIIHEASHTLGEAEISATVLELEIFSRAELRIPHYNGYVATYKIWPKEL